MRICEIKIIKKETDTYEPVTKLAPISVKVNETETKFEIVLDDVTGNKALKLETAMHEGDKISIFFESELNKVFTKSKYGKGAIYKMYSTEAKLKLNSMYKFHLEYDENFDMEFTSKYDPFFTTIKTIRNDTGTLLDNVKDETIADLIYDNSLYVINKLGDKADDLNEKVPLHVKNVVRYKTDIDLCYAIYLSKSGKLGSFKKKLADLDVSNDVKLPFLSDMLSRFKELLKPNEDILDGDNADYTMGFVKAKSKTYPVDSRGVF